jgi:antitoxin (DNA-binding transcriptional repressor) of toxin-antitoxin stability system
MAKKKVLLDFINKPVPFKIQYTRDRVIDMTGNANFTDPEVALADWGDSATDLETKYNAAQGGGPAETALQDAAEIVMDDLSRKQAAYVDKIADGSEVIITSAGFSASDIEPTDVPAPEKPENFKLKHGEEDGRVETTISPVQGAKGFVTVAKSSSAVRVTITGDQIRIEAGDDHVIIHAGTHRNAALENLESGNRYDIFKYAFNASGKGIAGDTKDIVAP